MRQTLRKTLEQAEKSLPTLGVDLQRMTAEIRDKAESEPSQLIDPTGFRPVQPTEEARLCPKHHVRMIAVNSSDWAGHNWFCVNCMDGFTEAQLEKVVC